VTAITQASGIRWQPQVMFIVSAVMALVGFAGILVGRMRGKGNMPERPYRRVYGDAPGAWKPEER
jgi:hypothetical protein